MPESKMDDVKGFTQEMVPRFMREGMIPGLSISVIRDGKTIYKMGFGSRDLEKSLPATPDTLYGIGSCTKSFVAIGILQLVERGLLELDDPAQEYIPLEIGIDEAPITIHSLLTHSLGVPSLATSTIALRRGVGLEMGIPWGSPDDFYRHVNGAMDEVVSKPGEEFFYHNAGYRMLGHIIQEISSIPFHEYITRNIIEPLEMERTTLVASDFIDDPNRITPYWKKPDGSLESTRFPYPDVEDIPEFSFISAAGGIMSSVTELSNYLEMWMKEGKWGETQIISPESIDKIQTLHIERPEGYYGRYGYGYGWGINPEFHGYKMLSHGGSILVSTAYLAMLPELGLGVAIAANTTGPPYSLIAEGIFSILLEMDPMEGVPGLYIKERMEELTGLYQTYRKIEKVEVKKKGGMLYLERETPFIKQRQPLIPLDPKMQEPNFYILQEGETTPLKFVMKNGGMDLHMERYVYHRTGLNSSN
jgi:CubicO group peptidase (beta-lactamase class C family)